MIGIPLGLLAANATEWLMHKHVLHGLGRDKKSFWAFHWHEHHKQVRQHDHYDADCAQPFFKSTGKTKEAVALAAASVAVAPLFVVAPFFTGALWYSAANYYRKHQRSHLDVDWARAHLPWHYDHHMGPDQNANWCVTRPWFDHVMGTRKPYLGTERAVKDAARKQARAARATVAEAAAA